ncbi:nuclear transport factor 2 family protein [Peristeroidobacter soli]|uniref:nuclear transport factor 2 family protein n=1 Tax=Peristeroidobacter soli TaxID=2497877 RepID=UPI00101DC555|nr:nuclear transport factor 2 family protein [Peristeroidobacter soli]
MTDEVRSNHDEDTMFSRPTEKCTKLCCRQARTDRLSAMLDEGFVLTYMTSYRQRKMEWLSAIDSGRMRYHSAREESVRIDSQGDRAVLVGRSIVTATIYGVRSTWNLQLTVQYERRSGGWSAMEAVATTF